MSTALVVFNPNSPFCDPLTLPSRSVTLAAQTVTITQHYAADGRGGTTTGFGASVYPCAIALSHFVANTRAGTTLVRGKRVLELGTGLGLGAIAAHLGGAACVCATDGDAGSVSYATANVTVNDILDSNVACAVLRWGDSDALARLQAAHGPFDCVVAADIVAAPYAAALLSLVATLTSVCGVGVPFLLVHQRRSEEEEVFFSGMAAAGFDCTVVDSSSNGGRGDFAVDSTRGAMMHVGEVTPSVDTQASTSSTANAAVLELAIPLEFRTEVRPITVYRFDRRVNVGV